MTSTCSHPSEITLELIGDLIAKLEALLITMGESDRSRLPGLKSNSPQLRKGDGVQPVHMARASFLAAALTDRRTHHQTLLDLHVLHSKLGHLIMELEGALELNPLSDGPNESSETDSSSP